MGPISWPPISSPCRPSRRVQLSSEDFAADSLVGSRLLHTSRDSAVFSEAALGTRKKFERHFCGMKRQAAAALATARAAEQNSTRRKPERKDSETAWRTS